jgi:hypothetical protein
VAGSRIVVSRHHVLRLVPVLAPNPIWAGCGDFATQFTGRIPA